MVPWCFPTTFDVLQGGIGYIYYGMMWGTRWCVRLGACPGQNDISPCGSILRGGAGAASIVASRVCTLGGGVSWGGRGGLDEYFCGLPEGHCLLVPLFCEWTSGGWVEEGVG